MKKVKLLRKALKEKGIYSTHKPREYSKLGNGQIISDRGRLVYQMMKKSTVTK